MVEYLTGQITATSWDLKYNDSDTNLVLGLYHRWGDRTMADKSNIQSNPL